MILYDAGIGQTLSYFARTHAGTVDIRDLVRLLSPDAPTVVGNPAKITGATVGTRYGTITHACADEPQYERDPFGNTIDTGRTYLCQGVANYTQRGGDSGAPVFYTIYDGNPAESYPVGVHWGSGGIFSPIANVQNELSTSDWGVRVW